ncbi:MAG: outer membrane protein assembly factor BamA [Bauldia sp.]
MLASALLAPLFTVGSAIIAASPAQADVVRSIVVRGNTRIDPETVKNYVLVTPGREFGANEVNESVKALFATGLFADVKINQSGSALVVAVVENPVVSSVTFQGNDKIKTDQLQNIVQTKSRSVLSDVRIAADVATIKEFYRINGRASADVTPQYKKLDANRVNVVFVINEGDRTGIASIEIVGNHAFTSNRLRSVIQTRTTNWLSWLTKRDIYDQSRLDADQELLRRFYLLNGYADFRVISANATFDAASQRYSIVYTIDEGPKYTWGRVRVDSAIPGISGDSLMALVRTQPGHLFNATDLDKTLQDITIRLAQSGFAFATVNPRGDRNYRNSTIDLTYLVDEGPRVYIERIDIRGNTKTRDYVIRREFDIAEGDAYNRVLVDKISNRLRATGYFKTVAISAERGSAADRVILTVDVAEDSTGEFSAAGGYSTAAGFIAELSVSEKNFLGRGQFLRISVGIGQDNSRNFNVGFTEPYFLGSRLPVGFNVFRHSNSGSSNRPFSDKQIGGDIHVGLPINDAIDFQVVWRILDDTISNSNGVESGVLFPNGRTLTSSLGFTSVISTVDSRANPHEGFFIRLGEDFAGVGGDTHFARTTGDFRAYHELLPETDIVGMLRLQGGNIVGINEPVRTQDNFARGGETIRGFANLGIGPRTVNGNLPLGGKNFIAGTAEVVFPFPLLPDDFGLKGAVFADAGTLFGADVPGGIAYNDDKTIRSSVGASVIWASPFGPLRADFAQALTKATFDQVQIFRFSAASQF